jgi:hypothetical protein
MSLGKRRYLVDKSSVLSPGIAGTRQRSDAGRQMETLAYTSSLDPVREAVGKYWTYNGTDLDYGVSDNVSQYSVQKVKYDSETRTRTEDIVFTVSGDSDSSIQSKDITDGRGTTSTEPSLQQLNSDRTSVSFTGTAAIAVIKKYLNFTLQTDVQYSDHYTEYHSPFDSGEKRVLNENTVTTNGDVDFEYHYYDAQYESETRDVSAAQMASTRTIYDFYETATRKNSSFTGGNIILSPDILSSLQDISLNTRNISMYNDISFDTDSISSMMEKVETTNYTTAMMLKTLSYFSANGAISDFYAASNIVSNDEIGGIEAEVRSINLMNLNDFMENMDLSSIVLPSTIQVYDILENEKGYNNSNRMDLSSFFAKIVISGMFQTLVEDGLRTYDQILDGESCSSQTLFYELAKYENGTLMESYYIPNTVDTSINNIIDSHVRYDKEYQYQVYAHKMVIGTNYKYTGAEATPYGDSQYQIKVAVESTPSIVLMRLPYFTYTGYMIDSPGTAPNIQPIQYKGMDNRILFLLNQPIGEYDKLPITLNDAEQKAVNKYRRRLNLSSNSEINYTTDDPPASFQVYRLTKVPRKYTDFDSALRYQVSTSYGVDGMTLYSASIVDPVQPNTKYYYVFRSIDIHGNMSDFSEIYELQLINDSGAIYLLTSVVDIERDIKYAQPIIPFRNLLRVKPALQHVSYNTNKLQRFSGVTEINNAVKPLGMSKDNMWDQRFKFRLTSKNTGRKIDLNVYFNQEYAKRKNLEELSSGIRVPSPAPAGTAGGATGAVDLFGTRPTVGSTTAGEATGAEDLGFSETTRQVGSGRGRTSKLTGERSVYGGAGKATGAVDVRSDGERREDTSTSETVGQAIGATDVSNGRGTSY